MAGQSLASLFGSSTAAFGRPGLAVRLPGFGEHAAAAAYGVVGDRHARLENRLEAVHAKLANVVDAAAALRLDLEHLSLRVQREDADELLRERAETRRF